MVNMLPSTQLATQPQFDIPFLPDTEDIVEAVKVVAIIGAVIGVAVVGLFLFKAGR